MRELIERIRINNQVDGIKINSGIKSSHITKTELILGFELPRDFKDLYGICNGFECNEDIFNLLSLSEISNQQGNYGSNWFYFAEYMIFSDMWGARVLGSNSYEIFNGSYPEKTLTASLREFFEHFAYGNVFEAGGLYEWQNKLEMKG